METVSILIVEDFLSKIEILVPYCNGHEREISDAIFEFKLKLNEIKEGGLATSDFEQAWALYKKKGSKKNSLVRWKKLSTQDKKLVFEHIPKYNLNRDMQFKKDFERYLSNETFKDLVVVPKKPWESGPSGVIEAPTQSNKVEGVHFIFDENRNKRLI